MVSGVRSYEVRSVFVPVPDVRPDVGGGVSGALSDRDEDGSVDGVDEDEGNDDVGGGSWGRDDPLVPVMPFDPVTPPAPMTPFVPTTLLGPTTLPGLRRLFGPVRPFGPLVLRGEKSVGRVSASDPAFGRVFTPAGGDTAGGGVYVAGGRVPIPLPGPFGRSAETVLG